MSASLMALCPPGVDDGRFLARMRPYVSAGSLSPMWAWRKLNMIEIERAPGLILVPSVVAHGMLPEVHEAGIIMQSALRDYYLRGMKSKPIFKLTTLYRLLTSDM